MADVEEPYFGFLSVTTLKQWGVDKWDIAEVTLDYLNIISTNFQPDPHSHFAGYCAHIYIYISTTGSISIRCGFPPPPPPPTKTCVAWWFTLSS